MPDLSRPSVVGAIAIATGTVFLENGAGGRLPAEASWHGVGDGNGDRGATG